MSRVHDMGGRFGDGPVSPEPDGIPQLPDWQARALALTLAVGGLGQWTLDESRHARERLSPKDYARFSYFEKWMGGLVALMVEKGVLGPEDLQGAGSGPDHPLAERRLKAEAVSAVLARGGPVDRQTGDVARFQAGDAVRTRKLAENLLVSGGHTRLPGYAAGAVGTVIGLHGNHVFPDSNAHGLGEAPEPLYAVAFPASALWAHPEHPGDEVVLDLWQSYLEPA